MEASIRILILLLSSYFSLFAEGAPECLDQNFINEIKASFRFENKEQKPLTFDGICSKPSSLRSLADSLLKMKKIELDQVALEKPFNQNILAKGMWQFLKERAKSFVFDSDCNRGVRAYVVPSDHDGIIHLCPDFFAADFNIYNQMESLVHEARHIDDHGYYHSMCVRGPRRGHLACDENLESRGSYSVTVEFFTRIALTGINLSEPERYRFKKTALKYATEAMWNSPPTEALFVQTTDGKSFYMQNNRLVEAEPHPPGVYAAWDGDLVAFPRDREESHIVNTMAITAQPIPVAHGYLKQYNEEKKGNRPFIKDVLITQYFGVFLTDRGLEFSHVAHPKFTGVVLPLPGLQLLSKEDLEIRTKSNNSVYVLTENGKIFEVLMVESQRKIGVYPTKWSFEKTERHITFSGQYLRYKENGKVEIKTVNQWQEFLPLKNLSIKYISRPILWSEYFLRR